MFYGTGQTKKYLIPDKKIKSNDSKNLELLLILTTLHILRVEFLDMLVENMNLLPLIADVTHRASDVPWRKATSTSVTSEWFLPCVNSAMFVQVVTPGKVLTTDFTYEGLFAMCSFNLMIDP